MDKFKDLSGLAFCPECGEFKPLSDFNLRANGKPLDKCRKHAAEYQKTVPQKTKQQAGTFAESRLIVRLAREGIPACPGKSSVFKQVDIVAVWVPIKVASSRGGEGGYIFGLSASRYWYQYALVALHIPEDPEIFYFFDAKDPIFYHPNGKRKQGLNYTPQAHHHWKEHNGLNDENMLIAKNRFSLVRQKELEFEEHLRSEYADRSGLRRS